MLRIANPSLAVFLLSAALALVHCAANMSGTPPWSRLQKGAGEGGHWISFHPGSCPVAFSVGGGGCPFYYYIVALLSLDEALYSTVCGGGYNNYNQANVFETFLM
jgi:hypothetical protein